MGAPLRIALPVMPGEQKIIHHIDPDAIEGYTEYPDNPYRLDIHVAGKPFQLQIPPTIPESTPRARNVLDETITLLEDIIRAR